MLSIVSTYRLVFLSAILCPLVTAGSVFQRNATNMFSGEANVNSCQQNGTQRTVTMDGEIVCCSKCSAGFGMQTLCTTENQTVCVPCSGGKDFSSIADSVAKCKECSKCGPFSRLVKPCTPEQDTQCQCIRGYYMTENGMCEKCSKCPRGEGVINSCKATADVKCSKCQQGFYSDLESSFQKCLPCSKCAKSEKEMRGCNETQNRLCCREPPCSIDDMAEKELNRSQERDRNQSRSAYSTADERVNSRKPDDWKDMIYTGIKNGTSQSKDEARLPKNVVTQNDLIPLYCAIMSAVIIALVVYVVFKWWRRRTAAAAGKALASPGGSLLGMPAGAASGGKRKLDSAADAEGRVGLINFTKEGSPIPVFGGGNSPSHGQKRITDLSSKRMRQIEAQLDMEKKGNGWMTLAKALEFSDAEIAQFESQADLNRVQPAHFLLQAFASRPNATVAVLMKALQRCGRPDVIPLLKEHSSRHAAVTPNNGDRQLCLEMGQV